MKNGCALKYFTVSCQEKSQPYFLHNNFQNPIASKWMLSIDYLLECFVRIVAIVFDIFRLGPEQEFVDTPSTNKEHLNYRIVYIAVI